MSLAMKIAAAAKRVGGALETDKRNNEQKYDYISADKILQKCGQALAEEGVTVFPSIVNQTVETVEFRQGRVRYDASVEFVFFVADSDSQMELPWLGRGADYAVPDKAAYKAITSGHKYFLAKLLNVGVGNEDGEHEAAEQPEQHKQAQRNAKPARAQKGSNPPQSLDDVNEDDAAAMPHQTDADKAFRHFMAVGSETYGKQWDKKRHELCKHMGVESSKDLTVEQIGTLVAGMTQKAKAA